VEQELSHFSVLPPFHLINCWRFVTVSRMFSLSIVIDFYIDAAKYNRDFILAKMSPSQIEEGENLSRELYDKIYNQTN
jgi:hypothetical protein